MINILFERRKLCVLVAHVCLHDEELIIGLILLWTFEPAAHQSDLCVFVLYIFCLHSISCCVFTEANVSRALHKKLDCLARIQTRTIYPIK